MANLSVNYLGLKLKNPIVVGACNLSVDESNLKKMEEAGASAIVYKSLFEEQIQLESLELNSRLDEYNERHAEMTRLFPNLDHAGPEEHLMSLAIAKNAVKIPVIASINALYEDSWLEYALRAADIGVDALELNFYHIPRDFESHPQEIEDIQVGLVHNLISQVDIPVSVKLSPYYSNPLQLIRRMDDAGVKGFVLFNKLFFPDIDIEKETMHYPYNLSNEGENRLAIQYAGLLYGNINAQIAANTGIYSGKDVVKTILAGADIVQVVSALYKHKISHISTMLNDIDAWMESKHYNSIDDFKGKLSRKNLKDPFAYRRAQYVDILFNSQDIFRAYPMI